MFDILVLCYTVDMYLGADLPASVVLRKWVSDLTSSVDGTAPHAHQGREVSIGVELLCVVGILPFCTGRDVLYVVEIPTYLGGI